MNIWSWIKTKPFNPIQALLSVAVIGLVILGLGRIDFDLPYDPKNLFLLSFILILLVVLERFSRLYSRMVRWSIIGGLVLLSGSSFYLKNSEIFPKFIKGDYVHAWNVYHYYIGSKYFEELGHFDLYRYTVLADKEGENRLKDARRIRDLRTYSHIPIKEALDSIESNPFSESRWREFKEDIYSIFDETSAHNAAEMLNDLGYNAPPFGNFVFSSLANAISIGSPSGRLFLLGLDWLLLIPAFVLLCYAFGPGRGLAFFTCFMLFFGVDKFHFGSFFRFHWLVMMIASVSLYKLGHLKLAGAALAMAAAERVFPVVFLFGPGIHFVVSFVKNRAWDRKLLGFFTSFVIVSLIAVVLGSVTGKGLGNWPEFAQNLSVHAKHHYHGVKRFGLKRAFIYDYEDMEQAQSKSERKEVYKEQKHIHWIAAILLFGAVAIIAITWPKEDALLFGILVSFAITVISRYYWILWFLLLFSRSKEKNSIRGLLIDNIAIGVLIFNFLMEHYNLSDKPKYTFVNIYMAASIVIFALLPLMKSHLITKETLFFKKAGLAISNIALLLIPIFLYYMKLDLPQIDTSKRDVKLSIIFLGDLYPGDNYFEEQASESGGPNFLDEKGYEYSFARLNRFLTGADFAVGNLETPLTYNRDLSKKDRSVRWSNPAEVPRVLKMLGMTAVSLANNHSMDQGDRGLLDTLDALDKRSIKRFGAGANDNEAYSPLTLKKAISTDDEITVRVLGALEYRKSYDEKHGYYAKPDSPGVARLDDRRMAGIVKRTKRARDKPFVAAFLHWGTDYKWRNKSQKSSARSLIQSGVDLIVGHGAHRFQQIEQYRGKWILYSIGNFVMNSPGRYKKTTSPPYSLLARLEFYRQEEEIKKALKLYPIHSDNKKTRYQPRPLKKDEFEDFCDILVEKSHADIDPESLKQGKDKYGRFLHIDLD